MTDEYVRDLVSKHPTITEVWLFGTRANGRERDDSDWDYFVFADVDTYMSIQSDGSLRDPNIDLLVVHNPSKGAWHSPWRHGTRGYKDGLLSAWCWRFLTDKEAEYRATDCPDGSDKIHSYTAKAIRVWPPVSEM